MTAAQFVSHSGNHEDVLLNRAFRGQTAGFYVDVGAHHPVHGSNTKALYDRGWCGVNVEPNPAAAVAFARERPRDVNLAAGVGRAAGRATFFEVPDRPQFSTLSPAAAADWRAQGLTVVERDMDVLTLSDVCDRHAAGRDVDVLLVDVEGGEADVLAGMDFSRHRPKVLVIEAVVPNTNRPAHHAWEPVVLQADYRLTLFDGINRYYVRAESPELVDSLSYPVNCLDNYTTSHAAYLESLAPAGLEFLGLGRAARAVARRVARVTRLLRSSRQ